MKVSRNRVYRVMRQHGVTVPTNLKLKAKRNAYKPKPKPTRANQWWGIDMTKFKSGEHGWVYAVIVMDWYTKKVVGSYIGPRSKAEHWLMALNRAVNFQFPNGVRDKGLHLMADNGCQPTSLSFMRACSKVGIKVAYTSYNNPKGNADTERFMRTMKEEFYWLKDWRTSTQLMAAFKTWILRYNTQYLHSAIGYLPPQVFEEQCLNHSPLKIAC